MFSHDIPAVRSARGRRISIASTQISYTFTRQPPAKAYKAIYFDNEGHVIHYDVSVPTPTTAVLLSEPSQPGPQFRIIYELKGVTMFGKFQMRAPGQTEFRSYLEWSGPKK